MKYALVVVLVVITIREKLQFHFHSIYSHSNACVTFSQVIPLECYEGSSSTGRLVPIVPGGRSIPLTFHNRLDYIEKAVHFRLHEMDLQVS